MTYLYRQMYTIIYGCQKRKTLHLLDWDKFLKCHFHVVGRSIYIWIKLLNLRKWMIFS